MSETGLKRIMMTDDEPDILDVARLALEGVGGYEVETCGSGAEALERLPEIRPDLLLMDVMMPGMDGPTVLGRMRENPASADVPVIFMTAKVQEREKAGYLEAGAIGVISKPFDPMSLHETVARLWEARSGVAVAAG